MLINFIPIFKKEKTLAELASEYTHPRLAEALNSYVDTTLQIIHGLSDLEIAAILPDSEADDPQAADEADRHVGWNLAHQALHITASMEEAAAFSSIQARGIPIGGRLRSEQNWRQVTTGAEVVARLKESRRMCLAYLDTWPDQPNLAVSRVMPEDAKWPGPNATMSFLVGLMHWHRHFEQLQRIKTSKSVAEVI